MVTSVNKNWKSLYSYKTGKIYLHLKNNELVSLDFSVTNKNITNYSNNQQINALTAPPPNSTLFLMEDELYALIAVSSGNKDLCGNGQLSIIKYKDDNTWASESDIKLNFDDIIDASFYQYQTVLTSSNSNHTIYIYGGECSESKYISNRLLSLNINTGKVSNISTSTKPQPFYGASNILAPNPQEQLIIGGKSNQGWLNMYQLATWNFNSGWSFQEVERNSGNSGSSVVNSRTFPLLLPVFDPVLNESLIDDTLTIKQVLMIGGEMDNKQAEPTFAKLSMTTNAWIWNTTDTKYNLPEDEILGAATIFNTLLVINSTDSNNKRDNSYHINLYDADSFKPVETLKENTANILKGPNSRSSHQNTTVKIVLGTVLPILSLAIIAGLFILFFLRRNNKRKLELQQQQYNEIDYKYGYLNPPPSTLKPFYHHDNDSNSTLSGASIDSWMKKRQDYDKRRLRNSYLASNDTLNMVDDEDSNSNSSSHYDDYSRIHGENREEEKDLGEGKNPHLVLSKPSRPRLHPKKAFSFTKSPPQTPVGKIKRLQSTRLTSSEHLIPGNHKNELESDVEGNYEHNGIVDSEATSLDDRMDVQVLVSSKRRSILRVVNPDAQSVHDNCLDRSDVIREDCDSDEAFSQVLDSHFERIMNESDTEENECSNKLLRQRVISGQSEHN
ncbi:conserved hypothetical protein [Candida dubliniensis CD36]|uniref:Uncharacterized protein n=1 Tax=Candida dubliniensis (strain CD36 / ATCC MYA-646 / CBS 7987 / NCPF 3949 / NRRL Y-17841) TaxID=573826 RepID=B9WME5_CANDC|nr:conserved hypothetical protein [Candida dubliniensis CD36]CAX40258.1 conserved hypothetical protein [Candida dubliniensis CD36]